MDVVDWLIETREKVLDGVLRVDADAVLNDAPAPENTSLNGAEIAAEVKRAVNAFKSTAMSGEGSLVDYASLRDSEAYAHYRAECTPLLRRLNPASLSTRAERLAFWINLYNALIVDGVIALSLQNDARGGLAGTLAHIRLFRRAAYDVNGQHFNCDDIEHGVLRANRGHPYIPGPQFVPSDPRRQWIVSPMDPRIHFALNCASRSCPPIGVYDPESIDAQLDLATANFISTEVEVDPEAGELRLSQIFNWYAGDFGGRAGVIDFLLEHLPDDEKQTWLAANQERVKLDHQPYDWRWNAQS